MATRGSEAGGAATIPARSASMWDAIASELGARRARGAEPPRGPNEVFAVPDPGCPPAAPSEWQRLGATVDPTDTIPGPLGQPLQRLGSAQNAFARLQGPAVAGLEQGDLAVFTAVVAAPTALTSALVLTGAFGQAELHVDWTEAVPLCRSIARRAGFAIEATSLEGLGFNAWRIGLAARNAGREAVAVTPTFYVTSGIGNAGMAVGNVFTASS